jgi:hypothetical protein
MRLTDSTSSDHHINSNGGHCPKVVLTLSEDELQGSKAVPYGAQLLNPQLDAWLSCPLQPAYRIVQDLRHMLTTERYQSTKHF